VKREGATRVGGARRVNGPWGSLKRDGNQGGTETNIVGGGLKGLRANWGAGGKVMERTGSKYKKAQGKCCARNLYQGRRKVRD